MKYSVFIFKWDLRIRDNPALNLLNNPSHKQRLFDNVIPVYVKSRLNKFQTKFRKSAIQALEADMGQKLKIISENRLLSMAKSAEYIAWNIDPNERDEHGKLIKMYPDKIITAFDGLSSVHKADGTPYLKFAPFYKLAIRKIIKKPTTKKIKFQGARSSKSDKSNNAKAALSKFRRISRNYRKSDADEITSVSELSPYIRFGMLSIREIYWAIPNKEFKRQLFWRDFYNKTIDAVPVKKYKFKTNPAAFSKWKSGNTGIDIVDAGMRQLKKVGYMPNRLRLITSSYLVCNLGLDWRLGEKHFSNLLVDYDRAQNNGGWQWMAGTSAESRPSYQIMNPESQTKRFDPENKYIDRWLNK